MTMLLTERWPQRTAEAADSAAGDSAPGDNAAGDGASGNGGTAQELLAEMAALIRDTRPYLIVSAAVAAASRVAINSSASISARNSTSPPHSHSKNCSRKSCS